MSDQIQLFACIKKSFDDNCNHVFTDLLGIFDDETKAKEYAKEYMKKDVNYETKRFSISVVYYWLNDTITNLKPAEIIESSTEETKTGHELHKHYHDLFIWNKGIKKYFKERGLIRIKTIFDDDEINEFSK